MKLIWICVLLVVSVACAYAEDDFPVENDSNVEYNGKFHYHYLLKDGSRATQQGELKEVASEQYGEAIKGQFSFTDANGKEYITTYTADENGYRPVGDHIPTPPPTPESVLKTLRYLAEHPPKDADNH